MPTPFSAFSHIGLAVVLFSGAALAQNAALVGTIRDTTDAVVPQARVSLTNLETGVAVNVQADSDGNYEFPAIRPGNYSIRVEQQGFKTYTQQPISLLVDQRGRADVRLELGATTETVVVEGSNTGVQTESSTIGEVIDSKRIVDIPLNGRFFLDLALLVPGTVVPSTNTRTFLAVPTSGGALGLNSSGAREDQANYLFDGVNLSDMVQNQITFLPNVDSIQEFKIQTNAFSAEYGRNSGIIVNAVSKSGGNAIHGSAFEFLRNDVFDARNFFDLPRPRAKELTGRELPPFKRNIYGWAVGGPVVKNRTFFFQTFEGRRQRESDTFRTTVPTEAQRAAVTNPAIQKLLTLIPLPNIGGAVNNFGGSASKNRDLDQVSGKIDHVATLKDSISGTYMFQRDKRLEPTSVGLHNLPGFGDFRPARRQLLSLRYTHTLSPRMFNEFRAGFNRVRIDFLADEKANPLDFGMNIGTTENFPDIRITGGPAFGGLTNFPQGRADTSFQYTDTLSWVRGAHSMKFGFELRRLWNNNINNNAGGIIRFPSLQAFLAAQPNQAQVTRGVVTPGIRVKALNGFFQDDWKVTPRLTLNLGLRYEYNGVPNEIHNRLSNFDYATRQLVRIGTAGYTDVYKRDYNNFGPRAGFSFDPFGKGKTVLRGGFGLYFDQPVTNAVTMLGSNPPFATPITINSGSVEVPLIDIANPYFFPGTLTPAPSAVSGDFVGAYVMQYNLNVQHEAWATVFQVGYVGSSGRRLRILRDVNQAVNRIRPFPAFGPVNTQESTSRSNYNALWLSANRRLSRGLTFTASYTFSKSIDLNSVSSSNPQIQDNNNLAAERGLSDFDARHRFVTSAIYELPVHGPGWSNHVVGGWSLAGILNLQSGNPFSPVVSGNRSGSLTIYDRPNVVPGAVVALDNPSPQRWFNTDAFVLNPMGSFGNAGRNIITGPPFKNLDLALLKGFRIRERATLQFRAEFFDITNHANFAQPGNGVGTSTFGVVSATRSARGDLGSSRQIEFALRLNF